MSESRVGVLLVDDHDIWRGGVRSLLKNTEFDVVDEASNAREAAEAARRCQPRIALLDIRMAGGDGFEALATLKGEHPRMAILMLTTYENPTFLARAIAGGAAGYLLKGIKRADLIAALRTVAGGETLLAKADFVRSLRGISEQAAQSGDLLTPLTPREQEVLRLLATGLSNREIAQVLLVSEGTVKTHVEHVIGKLGVSDRVQAAVWAARQGIVTESDLQRET